MWNGTEKFYPKLGEDRWGKKFFFHYGENHFQFRFSGRPLIILEKFFILNWWNKERFMNIWELASDKKPIPSEYTEDLHILKIAMQRVEELWDVFELCEDDNKSPFVIYVTKFNAFK